MKTIIHCIRCRKEYLNNVRLTDRQIEAVREVSLLHSIEITYVNIVCMNCRHFIGDEIADNILKIFNDERKE